MASSWIRALEQLGRVGQASTNTGRFRVGDSHCWQRPARFRKQCYHSCHNELVRDVTSLVMVCKLLAVTTYYYFDSVKFNFTGKIKIILRHHGQKFTNRILIFPVKLNLTDFAKTCYRQKLCSLLCSNVQSFIDFWVKIGHTEKSEWNPVQSSRSKSTTSPRTGCLLNFQSNCTATSDGGGQKAWKRTLAWFWIDCNQNSRKWKRKSKAM